mgnify:CR=1 FL=1
MKGTHMNKTLKAHATLQCLLACAVCFSLLGCGVEMLATSAVEAELQAKNAQAATRQLDIVKGRADTISFSQAVQAYRAENGANPPSLDALVPKYLAAIPRQADGTPYAYDPATGSLKPGDAGVSQADQKMIETIKSAIHRYGTTVGYYPPTLDTLYPDYLSQRPRTSAGGQFIYNNQNGDVRRPGGNPVRPIATQVPPSGGLSPVGQALTGGGMQQPLGNGSTAGATAARSHIKSSVQDISQQSTDRQNQVMNQLGL